MIELMHSDGLGWLATESERIQLVSYIATMHVLVGVHCKITASTTMHVDNAINDFVCFLFAILSTIFCWYSGIWLARLGIWVNITVG